MPQRSKSSTRDASLFDEEVEAVPDSSAWKLFREHGIRIGTASWTDKTLLEPGLFYPKGMSKAAERLAFYAENFPIVEVDSTYYGLPSEKNSGLWVERTPEDFVFNVKAFSLMTQHPATMRGLPKDLRELVPEETAETKKRLYPRDLPKEVVDGSFERFLAALEPLRQANKLGAILFQFPEWFPPSRENRDYVIECGDRVEAALPGVSAAIEFRNDRWMLDERMQERTLKLLSDNGLTYVCVDMPQGFKTSIPPVAEATAPLSVVRFHGRRDDTWGKRSVSVHDKFGYDYSKKELKEWQPRLGHLADSAREVHVLMNNCYQDYAVRSARTMAQLALAL
jgi:uncharacterized protein YecE (DUF72 family)